MKVNVTDLSINHEGFCGKSASDYESLRKAGTDYPIAYGTVLIDNSVQLTFGVCEANCLTNR